MKKKTLIFITFVALGLLIVFLGSRSDEPLDPLVAATLTFRLPETAPGDNAYIGVSGLGFLQQGDVVTAGKKYLDGPQASTDSTPASLLDYSYANPCLRQAEENCLDQILADSATIDAAVEKYKEFLDRYQAVQNMPLYVNTSYFSGPSPDYQTLVNVSKLVGDKALLDIKRGDLKGGLDALEKDLNFAKRMIQSQHIALMDLLISIALVARDQILLGLIIEDGRINITGEEERLRKMLGLDWDTSQMMIATLVNEGRQVLRDLEFMPDKYQGRESDLKEKLMLSFFYKRNMTLNRIARILSFAIGQTSAAPLLDFPDYFDQCQVEYKKRVASYESSSRIRRLYDEYGLFFFKNYYGDWMIELFAKDFYIRNLGRLNDTLVRSRLRRAQLELRLMLVRPDDLSQALAHLGPETMNPYTGQPFEWDKENNVLWAELLTAKRGAQGGARYKDQVRVPPLRL